MTKKYLEQYDDGNPSEDTGLSDVKISKIAKWVGEVIFLFNYLESEIERLIAEVVNMRAHQPGYAVIAELTPVFTKKISVFQSMYGILIESSGNLELKNMFTKIVKKLYEIKDVRNDVTHANWLQCSRKYEVRLKIASDERGPYTITKIISPRDLKRTVAKIEELLDLIERFKGLYDSAL